MHRIEQDSIGTINVPKNKLWGAQTQRSILNFNYNEIMPSVLIRSLAKIKLVAAKINYKNGLLSENIYKAIVKFAEKISNGEYIEEFPLAVWQTGSGTQTNMNMNEVISNLASIDLQKPLGSKDPVHPNDHVNLCQSSNDTFPTAMHIAIVTEVNSSLLSGLKELHQSLLEKAQSFANIVKIGRTHLQDATPLTLGNEFSGYASQVQKGIHRIEKSLVDLLELAQGGTAVGTGLNSTEGFAEDFAKEMSKITGFNFITAPNKFEALASNDAITEFSGTLNTVATSLMKITNDIRLLSSGPRAGIGEITIPSNEPGSSIMPGKINPTQCESLTMICAQVMGNHVSISIGNSNGHLELNVFRPMICYNLLQSIDLLGKGSKNFSQKCVQGIQPNTKKIKELVDKSLMLVTALTPVIGYDKSAQIAKTAHDNASTLKEAALKLGFIDEENFDKYVRPENMIHPKKR